MYSNKVVIHEIIQKYFIHDFYAQKLKSAMVMYALTTVSHCAMFSTLYMG